MPLIVESGPDPVKVIVDLLNIDYIGFMKNWIRLGLLIFSLGITPSAWSQVTSGNANGYGIEYGLATGVLLPDQIEGVTEVLPYWTARMAWSIGGWKSLEISGANATAEGVRYNRASLSLRTEIPMDQMSALLFLGVDGHYLKPEGETSYDFVGGGHVGAGMTALIGDMLWLRTDMNFSLNPGVGLWIGFGFVLRE